MKFQNSDKSYIELERITHEMYWSIIWLRYSLTDKESQKKLEDLCWEYIITTINIDNSSKPNR